MYAAGSYLSNPRVYTNVPVFDPISGAARPTSVSDEYSAHAGVSYYAWAAGGLSFSLGRRIDGVPVRDLFGWNGTSFRHGGGDSARYLIFLSYTRRF